MRAPLLRLAVIYLYVAAALVWAAYIFGDGPLRLRL